MVPAGAVCDGMSGANSTLIPGVNVLFHAAAADAETRSEEWFWVDGFKLSADDGSIKTVNRKRSTVRRKPFSLRPLRFRVRFLNVRFSLGVREQSVASVD